jgi:hypothetical protein
MTCAASSQSLLLLLLPSAAPAFIGHLPIVDCLWVVHINQLQHATFCAQLATSWMALQAFVFSLSPLSALRPADEQSI